MPGESVVLQTELVWAEYRERLVRFLSTRVGDRELAEDIAHDVLLRAYRARGSLRDEGWLGAWLFRIARNAVADHFRGHRRMEALPEVAAPDGGRDASSLLADCLRPLVGRLPLRYRAAVQLSELVGVPQREVAARLGISLSGAKSRVQRGRRLLRESLLRCCAVEFDAQGGVSDFEPRGACGGSASETPCGCAG